MIGLIAYILLLRCVIISISNGEGVTSSQQFICPNGDRFSHNGNQYDLKSKASNKCANDNDQCPNWMYAWQRNTNHCSIPGTPVTDKLRKDFEGACWIHDVCYNSLTASKPDCDLYFLWNLESTCIIIHDDIDGCMEIADAMYNAVSVGGKEDTRWKNANCKPDSNKIKYIQIKQASGCYYIGSRVNDVNNNNNKHLKIYINNDELYTQFTMLKSEQNEIYYIQTYAGYYLSCTSNGLIEYENTNSLDQKFVFVKNDNGNTKLLNEKWGYVYRENNDEFGCSFSEIGLGNEWIIYDDLPNPPIITDEDLVYRVNRGLISAESITERSIDSYGNESHSKLSSKNIIVIGCLVLFLGVFALITACINWRRRQNQYESINVLSESDSNIDIENVMNWNE